MTDRELRQNVLNALEWEPSVDATDVGVTVDEGVVTLRGDVRTYSERGAAERVALRVFGVKAVANDLKVRLASGYERTDGEIAQAAVHALQWNTLVPKQEVIVTVSDGIVTLKGSVEWQYQKDAAARAVRDLRGVKSVINMIAVRPHVHAADVQSKIENAFKRSAEIDARRISVAVHDGRVMLSGNVHTWAERREAARAAWSAPGVREVEDRLVVVP